MKCWSLFVLPFLIVVSLNINEIEGNLLEGLALDSLLPALKEQLKNLWQNHDLEFLGYPCFYFQKPSFHRWQLYYKGRFICPTWTNVRGEAKTRSQSGVLTATISDFLTKVRDRNLISAEEAQAWLQGFQ